MLWSTLIKPWLLPGWSLISGEEAADWCSSNQDAEQWTGADSRARGATLWCCWWEYAATETGWICLTMQGGSGRLSSGRESAPPESLSSSLESREHVFSSTSGGRPSCYRNLAFSSFKRLFWEMSVLVYSFLRLRLSLAHLRFLSRMYWERGSSLRIDFRSATRTSSILIRKQPMVIVRVSLSAVRSRRWLADWSSWLPIIKSFFS